MRTSVLGEDPLMDLAPSAGGKCAPQHSVSNSKGWNPFLSRLHVNPKSKTKENKFWEPWRTMWQKKLQGRGENVFFFAFSPTVLDFCWKNFDSEKYLVLFPIFFSWDQKFLSILLSCNFSNFCFYLRFFYLYFFVFFSVARSVENFFGKCPEQDGSIWEGVPAPGGGGPVFKRKLCFVRKFSQRFQAGIQDFYGIF